jgi:hypothetical protein
VDDVLRQQDVRITAAPSVVGSPVARGGLRNADISFGDTLDLHT